MKVTKANLSDANMSCLQGYVNTTYARLIELFGKPNRIGGDKVNSEWILKIDGDLVTIYDYKMNMTPTDDYDWHIGGHKKSIVAKVQSLIGA